MRRPPPAYFAGMTIESGEHSDDSFLGLFAIALLGLSLPFPGNSFST
jgi:hypothetical protein